MSVVEVSADFGGRKLTLQTGKLAKQADASVLATYGETMVLVTVVASRQVKEGQDFFPLTVDVQEKYYAAGRIPGGFFKREARPSEKATLTARLIDRPIRPLFPEDFLCDTNVVATILSLDSENEFDIVASVAASAALHISDIPWNGPIGTVRVGCIDGKFVLNPPPSTESESTCDLLVSGVKTGVIMVEGSAHEISEKVMMDAIDYAHESMKVIFNLQDELKSKVGKEKRDYPKPVKDEDLKKKMRQSSWPLFEKAFAIREKLARYESLAEVKDKLKEEFEVEGDDSKNDLVKLYYEELKAVFARELTIKKKHRIDGRAYNAIRPIHCEIGLLPRVHGSSVFTRGETQVLAAVTLGTADDEQKIDSISGSYQKTFLLHYNFPPFSVGEARPLRPPGRREIGHGFLAERALQFIVPSKEVFPYTIRLVSETLESNGSSSMATVCSGSMALMHAGVPVSKAVAGVAMGLIKEGEDVAVLSDILGDEDHLGDMDFKVCGTTEGITAFQMDLKIGGVSREIMEQALEQAREGRLHVLEKMKEAISEPRTEMSKYAPRIYTMKVKPEKVREVIGSGGKVIRSIIERTGVKIDIEDDGTIHIASADGESAQKAIDIINQIVEEAEPGRIYEGRVSRIADFGAFVEIIPGTDGLCHISELEHYRVRRVEDVVKEGDVIRVKCLEVDSQGKIRLSRKALLPKDGEPAREVEAAVKPVDHLEEENLEDEGEPGPREMARRAERSIGLGAESEEESPADTEEAEGENLESEEFSETPPTASRELATRDKSHSEEDEDNIGNRIGREPRRGGPRDDWRGGREGSRGREPFGAGGHGQSDRGPRDWGSRRDSASRDGDRNSDRRPYRGGGSGDRPDQGGRSSSGRGFDRDRGGSGGRRGGGRSSRGPEGGGPRAGGRSHGPGRSSEGRGHGGGGGRSRRDDDRGQHRSAGPGRGGYEERSRGPGREGQSWDRGAPRGDRGPRPERADRGERGRPERNSPRNTAGESSEKVAFRDRFDRDEGPPFDFDE